ncbi:hypothetical protein [Streptomyces sp. NPDC050388]|uniref:hypothetical protein n=1 Tax=Streptomyces sp. NPDC050388 TaxID=3155781 RepID=UPI00343279B1
MRKYQKAAVVMAMLGSVGFLGAGVSHAGGEPEFELNNKQSIDCSVDNSTRGLINVEDVNLGVTILGFNSQEANDVNAPACSTNFLLGGK